MEDVVGAHPLKSIAHNKAEQLMEKRRMGLTVTCNHHIFPSNLVTCDYSCEAGEDIVVCSKTVSTFCSCQDTMLLVARVLINEETLVACAANPLAKVLQLNDRTCMLVGGLDVFAAAALELMYAFAQENYDMGPRKLIAAMSYRLARSFEKIAKSSEDFRVKYEIGRREHLHIVDVVLVSRMKDDPPIVRESFFLSNLANPIVATQVSWKRSEFFVAGGDFRVAEIDVPADMNELLRMVVHLMELELEAKSLWAVGETVTVCMGSEHLGWNTTVCPLNIEKKLKWIEDGKWVALSS